MGKLRKKQTDARRGTFADGTQSSINGKARFEAERGRDLAKQKSDMKISLERENGRFLTGELIKGNITIALTQEVRVKDLTLKFFGDGRVSWNERRSYFKGSSASVNLKNTDVFLNQTLSILWKGSRNVPTRSLKRSSSSSMPEVEPEDSMLLPAGVHNFPFQYRVPVDLPASTFDGRWGQVRYTLKAVLQRPWKFDIERERDFTVITVLDLNDEPELSRPIGGLGEFSAGAFCVRSGQVTAELRIGRRGYSPGEKITFHVEIENNTRQKLYNHRVALVQHSTYRASRKARKLAVCISSVSRGEILPGASSIWTNDCLFVPVVPPTSNRNYRNIQIKYTFTLFVCHSTWSDEFCLPVTVVIGTSGLKRETINSYLSILGCAGPTPKPSPMSSRRKSADEISRSTYGSLESSSKYFPVISLTAPGITLGSRSPSKASLQLNTTSKRSAETGHASSANAIHSTLDLLRQPTSSFKQKELLMMDGHRITHSCRTTV